MSNKSTLRSSRSHFLKKPFVSSEVEKQSART